MPSTLQIDLLAAARCNMFSQALLTYMTELRNFAQKAAGAFDAISKTLQLKPKYDFCVLKELTQYEGETEMNAEENGKEIATVDKDQSLFFAVSTVKFNFSLFLNEHVSLFRMNMPMRSSQHHPKSSNMPQKPMPMQMPSKHR